MIVTRFVVYFFAIVFLSFQSFNTAFGQDLDRKLKRGKRYFERGNYVLAEEHLREVFEEGQRTNGIAAMLSNCYFELHEPGKAKQIIEKLEQPSEENLYQLAWANYFIEEFDEASNLITNISTTDYLDLNDLGNKITLAADNYEFPEGFVIQNFGENINSADREYSAVMYNDFNTLLFTTRREGSGSIDVDGLAFETIFQTQVDSSNNWVYPDDLKVKTEGERQHDATVQVYDNGNKMISYHDGHLYFMELERDVWDERGQIQLYDEPGTETHAFITEDERTIYFSSDHLSYGENLDLFRSTLKDDGSWSDPEPLTELNTDFDEDSPFLSDDGTLYFSSRGHDSMGGYDVFGTRYNKETGSWSTPVNLGHPINSVAEDIYYTTYGKLGYLSSSRRGGYGSLDLYRVFLFNKVKIQGKVVDENDGTPLPGVQVDFEYDSLLIRSYSDINGDYEMFVPINKEMHVTFVKDSLNLYEGDYIVNVFFKDENKNEFNFFITEENELPQNVAKLQTTEEAREIKVDIKNDFGNNPILAVVPKKLDREWADSLNEVYQSLDPVLSETFRQIITTNPIWEEAENEVEDEVVSVDGFDKGKEKVELLEDEIVSEVSGSLNVYFDFDSYVLNVNAKSELDQLYENILRNNDLVLEIEGHSDSRGTSSFNIRLSLLRANSVLEYLISKGLPSEKLFVHGLGETQLMDPGQSEAAHSANRRVELKYY